MVGFTILILIALAFGLAVGLFLLLPSGPLTAEELQLALDESTHRSPPGPFGDDEELSGRSFGSRAWGSIPEPGRVTRPELRQLRRGFLRAWSVCRLLAPVSEDPSFLSSLIRQFFVFHLRFFWIYAHDLAGVKPASAEPFRDLVESVSGQHREAAQLLAAAHLQGERSGA